MRRLTGTLLAATLLLAACQGSPLTTAGKKTSTKTGTNAQASAKPSATTAPIASTAPAKPAVPLSAIAGSLRMDASYVVAAGGGNVVAAGGGNVIAAGGGNLISVGGQVIAAGGGNVVAAGGGNVIAAGGGNAVAAGGANYRIAADAPAYGTLLPAKGMVVVPVSLKTGKPIGDAVFTDEQGNFTLNVPKSETGNVRLVAAVPSDKEADALAQDHRLSLEMMVALGAGDQAASIDDDTSLVSHYARETFAGRMLDLLKTKDQKSWGVEVEQWATLGGGNALIKGLLDELYVAITDAHCADLPEAEQRKLAEAMSDVVMAYVDLDKAMVDKKQPNWKPTEDEKVFDAMIEMIRACREGATTKMAADRAYFAKVTYLSTLMGEKPAEFIKRPADFCDFMVTNYLTVNDSDRLEELRPVFTDLGCNPAWVDRLKAAEFGMLSQVGMTMFLNAEAKEAMFALVRASKK